MREEDLLVACCAQVVHDQYPIEDIEISNLRLDPETHDSCHRESDNLNEIWSSARNEYVPPSPSRSFTTTALLACISSIISDCFKIVFRVLW